MKRIHPYLILTVLVIFFSSLVNAQDAGSKKVKKTKEEKEAEDSRAFAHIDSLVNSQQFVFKPIACLGCETFIVVDSTFAAVQNGNRNNLEGRITQWKVKRNYEKKTLAVTIKMRGTIETADIFLFIGTWGNGKATINSSFPGNFAFDGEILDFEHAGIYEGGALLIK
jgi:hypothetical protein